MVEPAQHIALLCNPMAGVGYAVLLTKKVIQNLLEKDISHQAFFDSWPASFEGYTDIWVVGGDGTYHHFINRYPNEKRPLGLINGGTGNDFHWQLYHDLPLELLINRILTSPAKPIDLGICNGERFINGLGIGFEGAVAKTLTGKNKKPGKASYMASVIRNIFGYKCKAYQISFDDKKMNARWLMIDINNSGRTGGGFHVSPQALPDDGYLDLMTIDAVNPFMRIRYLPVIEKGKHLSLPFVKTYKVKEVSITSPATLSFHMDGDYLEAEKISIAVIPGALSIRY